MAKRRKIFNEICFMIETPMLGNDEYCSIASVDVYFNEYGNVVVSATNHDGSTGYYSLSLEQLLSRLDNDALNYMYEHLKDELNKRKL